MAQGMMSGLFDPAPSDIAQAQYQQGSQQAMNLAQLDPYQSSAYMMGMAGQGLAAPVASVLGLQNTDVARAQQTQAIQQGIDHTTPEGLMAGANAFNKAGNPRMAMGYYQAAQQLKQQQIENQQADEVTQQRRDAAEAAVKERADAAKQRSEDRQLSIEQRAEAARQHNELMLQLAGMKTNTPFGKINPSQYTQESVNKFTESGDYGDLIAKTPAGGGGTGGTRNLQMTKRVIAAADLASADIDNLMKLPAESSTGIFGGRTTATGLTTAPFNALVNAASSQSVQDYNATATGLQRNLAAIEAAGLMPSGSLTHQMESVMMKEGDTNLTKLRKMAQIRQIVEYGLTNHLDDPTVPPELKTHMIQTIERVKKSVPFTVDDVNELRKRGQKDKSVTLGSLYSTPTVSTEQTSSTGVDQSTTAPKIRVFNPATGRLE